jgi:AraC family transcriptional regulator of adaptative response / methylphosphotriester-DNA alkyltransferase methyltransferase
MISADQEKWDAVLRCDESYDGRFFYGVKTTGIFCRPSCKSKPPLPANVEFFDEPAAAYERGLRPCKRCRPDLLEYKPMMELLRQVKAIFDADFSDREKLVFRIRQFPVSSYHLTRLFRQEFGMTPTEYLNRLRMSKALECLKTPDKNILDVAYVCGFGSLSSFHACFKKQFGLTPNEYRRQNGSRLHPEKRQ